MALCLNNNNNSNNNSPTSRKRSCTNSLLGTATRIETTSTDVSLLMVTRSILSSVFYVTGAVNPPPLLLSPNMASITLCQKRLRTDCPTPLSLQFYYNSQTDKAISGNASKCEGSIANTETAERGLPHPIVGLSKLFRWPHRSTGLHTCETPQRCCQATG